MDGVEPREESPARRELTWHTIETNHSTNYGIQDAKEHNQTDRMELQLLGQSFLGLLQSWN